MYDQNMYDRDSLDSGLCRGPLLLLVFRAIFTGPRTATADPGMLPGKAPIAKKNQMTTVTPRRRSYDSLRSEFAVIADRPRWPFQGAALLLENHWPVRRCRVGEGDP
ncbi:hypothetical protein K474DRAFT_1772078 [Panus rudis PR-1116 ss-1]|nr:hypothetical protein K474DRAFT_1775303 [Panus rudis PR-1116 ss-1]KAI0077101.1 hypothetical protein K474DRAFT_1772078 [Panus rudis PR-1116 ss-1]